MFLWNGFCQLFLWKEFLLAFVEGGSCFLYFENYWCRSRFRNGDRVKLEGGYCDGGDVREGTVGKRESNKERNLVREQVEKKGMKVLKEREEGV